MTKYDYLSVQHNLPALASVGVLPTSVLTSLKIYKDYQALLKQGKEIMVAYSEAGEANKISADRVRQIVSDYSKPYNV